MLAIDGGRCGMIVPLSITFSKDFNSLREFVHKFGRSWISSFDNIPAALFTGVSQRCSIWISASRSSGISVTRMHRWRSAARPDLLQRIGFSISIGKPITATSIPKSDEPWSFRVVAQLEAHKETLAVSTRASRSRIGVSPTARKFVSVFMEEPPNLEVNRLNPVESTGINWIGFSESSHAPSALASLAGELFLWYWLVRGDGFHVTSGLVSRYLSCLSPLGQEALEALALIGTTLHNQRKNALVFKKNAGRFVGNYNFVGQRSMTRRADLIVMSGLGIGLCDAIAVFDDIQRVLAINEFSGEKSIPPEVHLAAGLPDALPMVESDVFESIDALLRQSFSLTQEALTSVLCESRDES